ncbi:gem-associated protein 5-like [Mizuhopecten yessoensis]|uniref:Gem-associated protein 5 n=1 Tax=Mizuhopecten yessoensis TaxID=6573 RepID=A0A210Q991_MIZYE|nr:gem-associated protein 5-like [Mizuhopecten yessoensis]OWF45310.1 Gem-associated protein 5 [Mizuhopecten yessoensis]
MMSEITIPASPNWYCTHVTDANNAGVYVFGARRDVLIFDVTCYPAKAKGVFRAHRDKVSAVALSPHQDENITTCCSGSEDGKLKIWNTETKEQLFEHNAHRGKLTTISWSPQQVDLVLSADDKGDIVSWQYLEGRLQTFSPENAGVMCLACSPITAGTVAVGYKTGLILVLDVKREGQILQRLRGHDEDVQCLVWCPVPGENFKPPKPEYRDLDDPVSAVEVVDNNPASAEEDDVDFGTDGHLLASGSKDKTIRIWSTDRGRQLLQLKVGKSGGRDQGNEYGGGKMWTTFVWLRNNPRHLISSSAGGDLLKWDITSPTQQKSKPFCAEHKKGGHYRMVFNLHLAGPADSYLCSMSMDRQVIVWNTDSGSLFGVLPTFGGFVYVAKSSPVDPGRMAVGVGDSMIRLWNLNNTNNLTDIKNLWQGIKTKVTALCWHPVKEALLAYGTDDGRVGVYDTLSNRHPNISSTYHKRTVYVVTWGPSCSHQDDVSGGYSLYSIGDGVILEHDVYNLQEEASDVNSLIQQTNGKKVKLPVRSEISWSPDFSFVAIGNDDGSVEIYKPPNFRLVATVHIHKKLINCIQWHPHITMASPGGSPYMYWIATASNEAGVYVVNLSSLLDKVGDLVAEPVVVSESKQCLLGHVDRVTGVAWSPHIDQHLATVSYDGQALVWDVDKNEMLACYQGHSGRLLCVQWNGLHDDLVITGADDFSLHQWRPSLHIPNPENAGRQRKQKHNKKKSKKSSTVSNMDTNTNANPGPVDLSLTTEDQDGLEKILEEKRRQLLEKDTTVLLEETDKTGIQGSGTASNDPVGIPCTTSSSDNNTTVSTATNITNNKATSAAVVDLAQPVTLETGQEFTQREVRASADFDRTRPADLTKDKKKKSWKVKSYFPLTGRAENRGKDFLHDDLIYLAKRVTGCVEDKVRPGSSDCDISASDTDDQQDYVHLGFFLDRRGMYKCLKQEGQHHRDHDNMDYYYQLEIWKGNINGALRLAREREELSDWLVSMAPMANFDTWITVCEDYATQLESEGQYHKAATYLLAAQKVYEAIELFRRHRLFKEAIALAKVRLSPFDPVLEELYTLWAQQLTRDGNYEQAAKCHLAMKQVQDAALLLARRYNQSSLRTASHICLVAGEKQQGLLYAYKVAQQYSLQSEWKEAYSFLKEQKPFQCVTAMTAMHELLLYEAQNVPLESVSIDKDRFTQWSDMGSPKVLLPDFMLDAKENEPISPWQPYLIDGHTFPHHVLRILHSSLGVSMDTTNLEDMYKALSVLHAGRQVQTDLTQLLGQVSMDLVLCLLSLLMSETPTAISHLLQAISLLHEAGHYDLMELILRLFLPQGPKYLLKLQQEVTAMRVVISMDNHSNVDGASKVHTIKRYMSEIREDDTVSNSTLRCRELDCLRAYYYLVILNFLREKLSTTKKPDETANIAESPPVNEASIVTRAGGQSSPNSSTGDSANDQLKTEDQIDPGTLGAGDEICDRVGNPKANENRDNSADMKDMSKCVTDSQAQNSINQMPSLPLPKPGGNCDKTAQSDSGNAAPAQIIEKPQSTLTPQGGEDSDSTVLEETESAQGQGCINKGAKESSVDGRKSDVDKKCLDVAKDKNSDLAFFFDAFQNDTPVYHLTLPLLSHLARGLLWDMQGKRFALTETLGYIHKAISQLLLAQKPSALPGGQSEALAIGELAMVRDGHFNGHSHSDSFIDHHSHSDTSASPLSPEPPRQDGGSPKKRHHNESVIERSLSNHVGSVTCPFHSSAVFSRSVSIDSGAADINLPLHEHLGSLDLDLDPSSDNAFSICSSCEWLSKSRKVIWEDEPHPHSHPGTEHQVHHGKSKVTSIVNPAKYINVPDEWYNTAADQKYCMPYVTMAILKEEQEYVMRELKRGQDALQMPFPNPLESVKLLLEVSGKSAFLSVTEKHQFAEKVVSWGMKFSVSSQQKEALMDSMHRTLIHE